LLRSLTADARRADGDVVVPDVDAGAGVLLEAEAEGSTDPWAQEAKANLSLKVRGADFRVRVNAFIGNIIAGTQGWCNACSRIGCDVNSLRIACGDAEVIIACGVESMTRAPFVVPKTADPFSRSAHIHDTTLGWRFINKRLADMYYPYSMGETAENVARQWNIAREEQDVFAFRSQEKYFAAKDENKWDDEITAVEVYNKDLVSWVVNDEHPRKTSVEKLGGLKPAFTKDGTVTAGNSSGINDGAAAMLLANEDAVKRFDLAPLAKIVSMAVAGVDPAIMGIGPVPATQKALKRATLKIGDLDLVELNEAFASQSIACIRELGLDDNKVNVNGGAIAIGHPLGCSGVRISTTLLHEMRRRNGKYGVATMCVGVGQGASVVYEMV